MTKRCPICGTVLKVVQTFECPSGVGETTLIEETRTCSETHYYLRYVGGWFNELIGTAFFKIDHEATEEEREAYRISTRDEIENVRRIEGRS